MPVSTEDIFIYQVCGTMPLSGLAHHGVDQDLVDKMIQQQSCWRDAFNATNQLGVTFAKFIETTDEINRQLSDKLNPIGSGCVQSTFLNLATCSVVKPIPVSIVFVGTENRELSRIAAQIFATALSVEKIEVHRIIEHRREPDLVDQFDEVEQPSTGYVYMGEGWDLNAAEFSLFDELDTFLTDCEDEDAGY